MTTETTAPVHSTRRTDFPHVAFIGRAGAGKTTCAQFLAERHGYVSLSFSSPLKRIAAQLWGLGAHTDRDKLQKLGVAVREIHEDTWVSKLEYTFNEITSVNPESVTVDDCRFENEYWRLKELGFLIVAVVAERDRRVMRLRANGKLQDEAQLNHVSETALDHIVPDYVVFNDGDDGPAYAHRQLTNILERERARS